MSDLDDRTTAALDRLEKREDPPPAPELPPLPLERCVFDLRLLMTEKKGGELGVAILGADGRDLGPPALVSLAMKSADLLAGQDWAPPPVKAAAVALVKAIHRVNHEAERRRVMGAARDHAPACAIVAWANLPRINGHREAPPPCTCAPAAGTA